MKTTKKKGFTLIELIVVIAIIGVLAAILVPAMLGYVKKSKIQGANSAASTILKACNSALAELDEMDTPFTGTYVGNNDTAEGDAVEASEVISYMSYYFDGAKSASYGINVTNGVAVACAAKSGQYIGTSPKVYNNKNYPDDATISGALEEAQNKYDADHAEDGD